MIGVRQKLRRLSFLVATALLTLAGATGARAQTITQYPVPAPAVDPSGITLGPDGAVWFAAGSTQSNSSGYVGRVDASGNFTEYPSPGAGDGSIITGPDGALWAVTGTSGGAELVRMTAAGSVTNTYPLSNSASIPAIAVGSDGALWLTLSPYTVQNGVYTYSSTIVRVTIDGNITQYPVPTTFSAILVNGIASGSDGALWFTMDQSNACRVISPSCWGYSIGRITTSGTITTYPLADASFTRNGFYGPYAITSGPDGALWFTDQGGQIGRITTSGAITNFGAAYSPLVANNNAWSITSGPDGALWYTLNGCSGCNPVVPPSVGRVSITGGSNTLYPLSAQPFGITAGPNGSLWFTGGDAIGVISFDGLTVGLAGSGTGQVTSSPAGITCGLGASQCNAPFAQGSQVTLAATPGNGSFFAGWSGGGCSGTGSCTVTLSAATNVTATFSTVPDVTLTVTLAGSGTGQVTSSPAGINCSATSNQCANGFNVGSQVTLTASASAGSSFSGWSGGGCSGTGGCTVTMNQAATVTATFAQLPSFMLSVAPAGNGSGTVSSSPSGINCGATCSASFLQGMQVTLSGAAAQGSTFTGWSGGVCAGANPCTVTMSANTNVTATFVQNSASGIQLVAAVLPLSRSAQVGATATAFATVLDAGPGDAQACSIAPATGIPASFAYQTTDPTTNALTGNPNTPANIAQGSGQSFVIAFTPSAAFPPTNVLLNFACANARAAPQNPGIDTLNLSASTSAVPDIVALAASGDPGYVDIPGATGTGDFAVATVNLGAAATITVAGNTGAANLPVTILVCQTNPASGACLATPALSVTASIAANATPTFGFFVTGSASVPDAPGVNRVFATFTDAGGTLRGETSVAVRTQ